MANYNKVLLMGNLTRDPQLTYLPSNTPVVEFGLAVNRRFKRQDGEQGEEVMFIDCQSFGRTAEVINQYLTKGRPIFIEGHLRLDQWQDKDGNKRSKHRVFVENFQFIDSKDHGGAADQDDAGSQQQSGGGGGYRPRATAPPRTATRPAAATPAPAQEPAPDMEADDIPF